MGVRNQPPRVMLSGDVAHRDFDDARTWLINHTQLATEPSLDKARTTIQQLQQSPQAIVVAQSRPGQFAASQIETLHAAAPLARLLALLGSWCEGEARTGIPWPGAERVYWHQWCARFATETTHMNAAGAWSQPRSATAAERFLARSTGHLPVERGLVAIDTSSHTDYSALADTCRLAGYATIWLTPGRLPDVKGIDAALWDGWSGATCEIDGLRRLIQRIDGAPAVALLSFPRREDVRRVYAAGAAAIVSKPFVNEDLCWQLGQVLAETSPAIENAA